VGVGGGVRAKGQMKFFGRHAQIVEDNARFDPRDSFIGIKLDDAAQILGCIPFKNANGASSRQLSSFSFLVSLVHITK
jgi:hypothetical protein